MFDQAIFVTLTLTPPVLVTYEYRIRIPHPLLHRCNCKCNFYSTFLITSAPARHCWQSFFLCSSGLYEFFYFMVQTNFPKFALSTNFSTAVPTKWDDVKALMKSAQVKNTCDKIAALNKNAPDYAK